MMMGALVVVVVDSDSRMVPCECCCCDVVVDSSYYRISLSLLQTKLHPVTRLCVYVFCYIQVPHFRRWLCVLVMLCALSLLCTLLMRVPLRPTLSRAAGPTRFGTVPRHTFAANDRYLQIGPSHLA